MRATGIVRRIDDLGRVVIPKEIRKTLRIREGDPLEIFTAKDGEVILKKYSPIGELNEFSQEYAETLSYLSNEFNKVDSILTAYYSQNILPKQYRNIASLIYIYDYMSSSQESFSNALLHEHMEKGIQEILSRLDYIIQQNGYMIFNQHRIEAQNQNIISQNRSMLETLERTERNAVEANQYAQLNYSKTTAFFAAATYLEQK